MSKMLINISHTQSYKEYSISKFQLSGLLRDELINPDLLWDSYYHYVSLEDWNKIFFDVLKNTPAYTTDKFDCDNFSLLAVARITERYKLNGCGIAIGDSPYGYHAWNIFVASPLEVLYLEPQTGQIIELDDGYKAHYIVWG